MWWQGLKPFFFSVLSNSGMTVRPGLRFVPSSLTSLSLTQNKVRLTKHPDTGLFFFRGLQSLLESESWFDMCLPVLWFVKCWDLWLCSGVESLRGLSNRYLITASDDVIMHPVPRTEDEPPASYKHYSRPGDFKNKGRLQLDLIV